MKKFFSVGEAAKAAHTTSETLRHYDRIGLVKPSKKDEWTNYRYYTEQDIVRLNTVRALQLMDLSLQEIKKVLEYDDLEKIVEFLAKAEKKADENQKLSWQKKKKKKNYRLGKISTEFLPKNCRNVLFCCRTHWKLRLLTIFGIISAISMIESLPA